MSLIIKKAGDGTLLGRVEFGPDIFLLSKTIRVAHHRKILVKHYFAPEYGMVVFAMNGVATKLQHKQRACSEGSFGLAGRREGVSRIVWYDGILYLVIPEVQNYGYCYLANEESNSCAGSNQFADGHLCLGTAIDPMDSSALDAFCFNDSNQDLPWMGGALQGKWITESTPNPENPRAKTKIFKVENWPVWKKMNKKIPEQIIADSKVW